MNEIALMKAKKNKVQMDGMRQANIRDSAAIMKYFAFLEEVLRNNDHNLTEYKAGLQLLEFRKQNQYFKGLSFETISAIGPNGAIIHYHPSETDSKRLDTDQIYLLDSGGQYLDGTTDITRTTHFGGKDPTPF